MNNKVAIIVTTMLRDELLEQCITAMLKYLPENAQIFIGDQGRDDRTKVDKIIKYSHPNIYYFSIPYNSGLSYGRNYLVSKAQEYGYDFCLIASDSMIFNEKTHDLSGAMKEIVEHRFDLVGLHLSGAPVYWVGWLTLEKDKRFILDFIDRSNPNIKFFPCSSCHNFFLATTESLVAVPWDNNLKLAEHEDFFYRYCKDGGFKCAWTPTISCDYFRTRFGEHSLVRQMNWDESLAKLFTKYNLLQWISQVNKDFGTFGANQKV